MATVKVNGSITQMIALIFAGLTTPYVGWGTGAGTSGVTDTTLFTENAGERAAAVLSKTTTTFTNDTINITATPTSVSGETITNAGFLDAASGGNLWIKGDFTGVVLGSGDKIQFTMSLQQT